jgi:hypothetical protein
MATFYKFGKLWEIPPAAARLGKSLPANTQAFETFLTYLEPMLSNFIMAHPRCPKDPDLPAIRYAIRGGRGASCFTPMPQSGRVLLRPVGHFYSAVGSLIESAPSSRTLSRPSAKGWNSLKPPE